MNSDNIILRGTDNPPLVNKDDVLTIEEIDSNFIAIYNDFISLSNAEDTTLTFDVDRTYLVGEYATYDGRMWVATEISTGVTPIEGSADWNDIFPTILAHEKNKDTILDEGGLNETTVAEIRAFIDAGLTSTTNLSLSTKTATSFKIESSTGADVTIPQANNEEAGLLNATDKVKLNNLTGVNTGDQTLVSLNAEDVDNKVTDFTTINNTLYPTTQAVDTYVTAVVPDLVETFIGGIVAQDLQDVTTEGNTTTDNIEFTGSVGVLFDNTSTLRKGTIDAGYGGAKGIAQVCAVGYELKWEAGRLYVMGDGGTTIREVSHNFTTTPTTTDDNTKGFIVGSRWILDNGDLYICTDTTTATAVWVLQTIDASPTDGSTKAVESNGVFDALALKSNIANPTFTGLTSVDTFKVTTGNYITPVDVVGIASDGGINRISASNGRTALGLGSLATQSGTFSGTSSGTNTGDQIISDATISLTDITTNNFSTTKHGFVPKGTNVGNFLKDDGTWGTLSSSGIVGIANASGVYTYYATLSLAMTAAVSGQTVDLLTDITETGSVTITTKTGVKINGNGYTYTLSVNDDTIAITQGSALIEMFNIKVVRTGRANNLGGFVISKIDTGNLCTLKCQNVVFESTYGVAVRMYFTAIYGLTVNSYGTGIDTGNSAGYIYNCIVSSSAGIGIYNNDTSEIANCNITAATYGILSPFASVFNTRAVGSSVYGITATRVVNSTGVSSTGAGISTNNGNNCVGISTSGVGLSGVFRNSTGISTSGFAGGGTFYNCSLSSSSNYALSTTSTVTMYNSYAESTSSPVTARANIYNSTVRCLWNNAGGSCTNSFVVGSHEVMNSFLEVTNASAYCITGYVGSTWKFAGNIYKGATTAVNTTNITQGITNISDTKGNILI